MDSCWRFLLELLITFLIIYLIYYFVIVRKNKKYDPNYVPVEVNLILLKHPINLSKINYLKMLHLISLVTSFNLALTITVVFYYIENVYLIMLVCLLIVVPVSLLGYHFIGNYFAKISKEK